MMSPLKFHIAPGGDDDGPGTAAAPFATLERARDAIRQARSREGAFAGAEVVVHGGMHARERSFELTAEDSGSPGTPVVYRAAAGEAPRLVGGRVVSGFAPVSDAAVLARLPAAVREQVRCLHLPSAGIRDYGVLRARGFHRPYVNAALEVFVEIGRASCRERVYHPV